MRLSCIVISIFLIFSCKSKQKPASHGLKTEELKIYLLSSTKIDHHPFGVVTIAKRKVIREVLLSKRNKEKFLVALYSKKNYEPIDRKCIHEPMYAVKIQDKLFALLDVQYCPFVEFIDRDGKSQKKQLIFDNTIAIILYKD